MALLSPNQDLAEETRAAMERQLEQQTRDATSGVLRRPGRGKRAGQWVQSGGEFNNLTQDEVYGRLRARQGGNSGSGPGGGLRTGSLSSGSLSSGGLSSGGLSSGGLSSGGLSSGGLSQGSGIDWLHENGPSRYDAVGGINQAQRNVKFTGDASVMSKPDKALFDKAAADKEAKAAADKAAADKAAATTSTPSVPDSLNTPVGQTAKPAIPPMIARPAEPAAPAKPVGMAPPGAPNYQAPAAVAAPAPAAPPVLAKPQVTTAATPAPAPVNPDPLAPAAPNPYPALARPQAVAPAPAPAPQVVATKPQSRTRIAPVNYAKKREEEVKKLYTPGMSGRDQKAVAINYDKLNPPPQLGVTAKPYPGPSRGYNPPKKGDNQTVIGDKANKRRKDPLGDMVKQGKNANLPMAKF